MKTEEGRAAGFSSGLALGKRSGALSCQQEVEEVAVPLRENAFTSSREVKRLQEKVAMLEAKLEEAESSVKKLKKEADQLTSAFREACQPSCCRSRSWIPPVFEKDHDMSWFIVDDGFPEYEVLQAKKRAAEPSALKKVAGLVSNAFGLERNFSA